MVKYNPLEPTSKGPELATTKIEALHSLFALRFLYRGQNLYTVIEQSTYD
jgi:hypothetical protein